MLQPFPMYPGAVLDFVWPFAAELQRLGDVVAQYEVTAEQGVVLVSHAQQGGGDIVAFLRMGDAVEPGQASQAWCRVVTQGGRTWRVPMYFVTPMR